MFWRWIAIFALFMGAAVAGAHAQTYPSSSGTGFFVNELGWLVTNAHVVDGCTSVEVVGHGKVDRQFVDVQQDVAAIHVTTLNRTVPLTFNPTETRLGQQVISLGFPLGNVLSSSVKMTLGNVSSLAGPQDTRELLQHTATISSGNSGGPLVDMSGRVVGINSAILSDPSARNINFAIKASVATNLLRTNQIEYTELPIKPEIGRVEDVVASAVDSVVQILCYGGNPATSGPVGNGEDPSATACTTGIPEGWYLALFQNLDFWGGDLLPKGTKVPTVDDCAIECSKNSECRAFTYNASQQTCFIKREIGTPVITEGIGSGLFYQEEGQAVASNRKSVTAEFRSYPSTEFSFFRNPRFQPGQPIRNIDECLRFCSSSSTCNYMTFDPGDARACGIWRDIPGRMRGRPQATSFERVYQSVEPIGTINLCTMQAE
jgi:serine protease Do